LVLFCSLGGWLVYSHSQARPPHREQARVERVIVLPAR
jgi:hypothetical protein